MYRRYAVEQLFEALCCYYPGVESACNKNWCRGYFLGGKGGRCLGLTTLSPYHRSREILGTTSSDAWDPSSLFSGILSRLLQNAAVFACGPTFCPVPRSCKLPMCSSVSLTLSLLMSYIYGASFKARNFNVVYTWTYVW
jgi:hypothetical protein